MVTYKFKVFIWTLLIALGLLGYRAAGLIAGTVLPNLPVKFVAPAVAFVFSYASLLVLRRFLHSVAAADPPDSDESPFVVAAVIGRARHAPLVVFVATAVIAFVS